MEAGIADHVWDVEDLVAPLPAIESKRRGPYKETAKWPNKGIQFKVIL
jgi:hypothetical protein